MSNNVIPLQIPTDEPVTILLDANVKFLKLARALAEAGFVFTFDRRAEVLRISERVSS